MGLLGFRNLPEPSVTGFIWLPLTLAHTCFLLDLGVHQSVVSVWLVCNGVRGAFGDRFKPDGPGLEALVNPGDKDSLAFLQATLSLHLTD